MATTSKDLALGARAPEFDLPDVSSGRRMTLDQVADGKALLVMFICRHCPYVKHVEPELARLARDYANQAVALVAISANDAVTHPEDAPKSLAEQARAAGFAFPYLYDEPQAVARAYGAACTPEFFLFDAKRALTYHGRLDASSPGNRVPLTGHELRAALDAVLAGQPATAQQHQAIGCGIKWKAS